MPPKKDDSAKIDLSWAAPNVKVWIDTEGDPSGECYKIGTILKVVSNEVVNVKFDDDPSKILDMKGDKIFQLNDYSHHPKGYNDMVEMENLSEAELLYNLRLRYANDMIFTYVGPTLIVLNPYRMIQPLFTPELVKEFQDTVKQEKFIHKEHIPHVFAIAASTLTNMFVNKRNQAVVIAGESGAGKTENTKFCMKFLTSFGESESESDKSISDKILACNPVLEAFGNAKTVRNDNSSRFGKYVALLVDKKTREITGATITNYLLEKSRVVVQTKEERNYHIYYHLIRGATEEELKKLYLTKELKDYDFLKNTSLDKVKSVDDVECYNDVVNAFKTMNFTQEEQNAVWNYTAASLLLGNVNFDGSKQDDVNPCGIVNEKALRQVCDLLAIDYDELASSLRLRYRTVGGQTIASTLKKEECLIFRDSLSKEIYNKLFNWLVKRLNFTTVPPEFMADGIIKVEEIIKNDKYYHIGLLDIFGFEIFKFNSLEQFCINFTNEKLQQLYIAYVFKGEEKEFINEGLKDFLGELKFKDNQHILDMLDSNNPPGGIFQLIDEASSVNSKDSALRDNIIKAYNNPKFAFSVSKTSRDTFFVHHSAKEVEYNINGFKDKNKDELSQAISDCLSKSKRKEIVKIWKFLCGEEKEPEESKAKNPKDKFLGYKFRQQIKTLMEELNSCECHFIRCIKPNETKSPETFIPALTLQQIKYMGILDTIKVRKDSFPVRRLYKNFYKRYEELHEEQCKIKFEDHEARGSDFKKFTQEICKRAVPHLGSNMILFGNTKIFLRLEAVAEIEQKRAEKFFRKEMLVRRFQNSWFRYKQLKKFRAMLKGIRAVQRLFKVRLEYQKFQKMRKMTKKIQRWWRNILMKRWQAKVRGMTIKIQSWWKKVFHRKRYLNKVASIKMINRVWRGALVRRRNIKLRIVKAIIEEILDRGTAKLYYKVQAAAAVEIQRWVRGHLTRCKYYNEVQRIRKAKTDMIFDKKSRLIQRNVRGWIVRSTLNRMHRAAQYIQGYIRMRWLSTIFQDLRRAALKIQRAARCWLARKKVVRERLQNFLSPEAHVFEELKAAEQMILFGVQNVKAAKKGATSPNRKHKTNNPAKNNLDKSEIRESEQKSLRLDLNQSAILPIPSERRDESGMSPSQVSGLRTGRSNIVSQDGKISPGKSKMKLENIKEPVTFNDVNDQTVPQNNDQYNDDQEDSPNDSTTSNPFVPSDILENLVVTREITPFSSRKINLFAKVIDIEIMADMSDVYDPLWSLQILSLQHKCVEAESDIQIIEVGAAHTLAVNDCNRVFSFGWNDCFQLGRDYQNGQFIFPYAQVHFPSEQFRPKTFAAGDDHNLLLDYSGHLYVWGDNTKGQLGLGHMEPNPRIQILEFLTDDTITQIKAKGNNNLAVTKNGKAYYWPMQGPSGEYIPQPVELSLPPKIQIATASCGFNFAVLVAKNGLVFSFGKDSAVGQLGHGDLQGREVPSLVEGLKHERVSSVSCGYKHVICRTTLGKVYTWGWGERGQLGHGVLKNQLVPKLVETLYPESKEKVLMIQAGYKHSIVLLETKKIMWWGSNSSINNQSLPIECDLYYKFKIPDMNINYHPVRIHCAWSKTMSVTYVTIADTRTSDASTNLQQKILSQLITKIEESYACHDVHPPMIESIANYFSMKTMKTYNLMEKKQAIHAKELLENKILSKKGSISKSVKSSFIQNQSALDISTTGPPQHFDILRGLRENSPVLEENTHEKEVFAEQDLIENHNEQYESQPKSATIIKKGPALKGSPKGTLKDKPSLQPTKKNYKNSPDKMQNLSSPVHSESTQTSEEHLEIALKLREIKRKLDEVLKIPKEKWTSTDLEFIKMATEPGMYAVLQSLKV